MKRKILCILFVFCLLLFAGCREPVPPEVNLPATEPSITAVEPTDGTTETTTAATEPEKTQITEATTILTELRTDVPMLETSGTNGVGERDSTISDVETTSPTETTILTEGTTSPISTEVTFADIDCEAAMNMGNQYGAATYGWIVDLSLNESNAGFNFGSWVFAEDGQAALDAAGIGQIVFLYNSLKTAYPDMEITGIRFRVHAFECGDGLYEVRVYYA